MSKKKTPGARRTSKQTRKRKEHWQVVENIAAHFERTLNTTPGVKIVQKAMVSLRTHPKKRREVDVLVLIPSGPRTIRLGIDVKNESRPLDQVKLGTLADKFRKLDLDRGIVVSTSGYTADAEEIYKTDGLELLTMQQVETLDWSDVQTMKCQSPHVELRLFKMFFPQRTLAAAGAAFRGLEFAEIRVLDSEGSDVDLGYYLARIIAEQMPKDNPVGTTHHFHFYIDATDADVRRRHRLKGVGECELPDVFECQGEYWLSEHSVPVFNFRYPSGEEAMTAVFDDGVNRPQQMTLIRTETPGTEGGEIRLVAGLANPRQTKV